MKNLDFNFFSLFFRLKLTEIEKNNVLKLENIESQYKEEIKGLKHKNELLTNELEENEQLK